MKKRRLPIEKERWFRILPPERKKAVLAMYRAIKATQKQARALDRGFEEAIRGTA